MTFGIVLAFGLHAISHADEIKLSGNARLTGTVRSISGEGVVELSTETSPEPVLIKAGRVGKVEFSVQEQDVAGATTLLEFINGDTLPVAIESLDATNLHASTPDAGKLVIPRSALKSMQLGVRGRNVIYTGPGSAQEWSRGNGGGTGQWGFTNGSLVANGPAYGSRDFDTPLQFILKFTLKWRGSPSYQIYFADPLSPRSEKSDRYYMQFNAAGIEIKRESATQPRPQTVILLARTPDQFPENQMEVEIRVNRKSSRMHLLLDGEQEAAGVDPLPKPPEGSGVQFVNGSPPGGSQEIRDIEILEFDNVRARHRAEDRGDPKSDSLISRDDDRWGGRLETIVKGDEGCLFRFKSDFQDEPLELGEGDVSTLFFAKADPAPVLEPAGPYVLRLRGEGSLRMVSCGFNAESVSARHPLLGALEINRAGVAAMERVELKPEEKAGP